MTRLKGNDWEETLRQQGQLLQRQRERGPQSPADVEKVMGKRRWFKGLHGSERITPPPRKRR